MCGELLSTHEFIIYLNTSLYRWYPIGIAILGALTFNSSTKVKAWFLHFVWMSRVVSKHKKILEKIKKMSTHSLVTHQLRIFIFRENDGILIGQCKL